MTAADYIDFHSHHPSLHGERVIQDGVDTWGVHPWGVQSAEGRVQSAEGRVQSAEFRVQSLESRVMMIGECGLDRLCDSPYELQLETFRHCILLSEKQQLPLLLHCVRAIDDVLRLRTEEHATQPWIWHGYRGNENQLKQLLDKGFWFSFGPHYNEQAMRSCPLDRLLIETDDTTCDIQQLYAQIATAKCISEIELIKQMHENFAYLQKKR